MIIDGKKLAHDIERSLATRVQSLARPPKLGLLYLGHNPVIERFVARKVAFGARIGVPVTVYRDIAQLDTCISENDGVVVQLPLVEGFDLETILHQIPWQKDVDVLKEETEQKLVHHEHEMFPPVAGAIRVICDAYKVSLLDKKVVVVGNGRLVGKPVATWLTSLNIFHTLITRTSGDLHDALSDADVVISGVGVPALITPEMIHSGMCLFDAGTSEDEGKLSGDISPLCAEHAEIFTPVPGGIGPLTIAVLFTNILNTYDAHNR